MTKKAKEVIAKTVDFYPVSGYRDGSSGSLGSVGTLGFSWSRSPASATSMFGSSLNFHNSRIYPEDGNFRAGGFPVRCVQE